MSGREAIDQIRWAHGRGLRIYAETCPQYLFLTADDLGGGYEGAKCVCSPPPRDRANQRVVWNGLSDGLFTIVSSDHAPFRFDDPQGKKPGGKEVPFSHIPNGIPGLETRLPLLFPRACDAAASTLNQFVALTATNPAKLYGLHPRKGTIAVGSDADIAIWDPTSRSRSRTNAAPRGGLHALRGHAGHRLAGDDAGARRTRVGRRRSVRREGHGRFLPCGKPEMARPEVGGERPDGHYVRTFPMRWASSRGGRMIELDASQIAARVHAASSTRPRCLPRFSSASLTQRRSQRRGRRTPPGWPRSPRAARAGSRAASGRRWPACRWW